mmetsp:Transcript_21227/g.52733  ORF Transcript_21227/g.52733 Transcript_21227/m.52733 type:complete len:357 (+) Transcript_21227:238-1308(+)|eukprot:CAMPEP_0197580530 /NCGR_PEP_ID=MMETSP1326-20131121/4304_1 /TAXON_ID=1155430 /ORGANISM="Genus nov. species nov., Strain RCC2288" /LENGTH=356 /DNA_ID=CAMNT_0043144297 /DNA_START=158 /DNA_END=1228 /DNA_ORIENTATION=+
MSASSSAAAAAAAERPFTNSDGETGFWFMRRRTHGTFSVMTEFDEFVRWEEHPLRYLFATIALVSTLTWLGFAGDNLQHHRMYGSLSFTGGCTFRQLWKNSWNSGGSVLLLFRASAFAGCAWFTATQIINPNVAAGSRVSDFMNFHDWSFYILTLFFFFATITSLRGVCIRDSGYEDRYIGHAGAENLSGHWLITLYSMAFTLALACDVLVWVELLVYPQCVSETFRSKMSTLLDPTSRLCYFEWNYLVGFMGNILLLLVESTLGQLPFPKCYLSSPLFVVSAFVVASYLLHETMLYRWPYEQMNFFKWQSIFYVNGFFFLVFFSHFFLNWFLSMGHGDKRKQDTVTEEHIPLFKQ